MAISVSCTLAAVVVMIGVTTSAVAAPTMRDAVSTRGDQIITNSFGNCVRTKWVHGHDVCAPPEPPKKVAVQAAPPPPAPQPHYQLSQEERTVHFDFDSAELRPDAKEKLDHMAQAYTASPKVVRASIVGYADEIGATSYNQSLSAKRARAVQEYLGAKGYLNTQLADVRALGEGSVTSSCEGVNSRDARINCLQPDRKVEVEVDYMQESAAVQKPYYAVPVLQ